MRVYLESIGCRLNQSEIESMARQLLAGGHDIVKDATSAERVIVNTCAVTSEAARDARRLSRRVHRDNPEARVLLTGCYATVAPGELETIDGVDHVVANERKDQVAAIVDPSLAADAKPAFDREPILRELLSRHTGNTRAFVKVQDGCDNRCTFCVTTVARGAGVSRRAGDVVTEIEALSQAGYREAVLTGVHLGSYGRDLGSKSGLRELAATILERTDIARLRLSSLEPWDLAPDFFDLWANPRLLPHLHLPLQAGCDRTLRRMARNTTCRDFRALVDAARERIPELSVTTDVIVGFPGETDADFEQSLAYVESLRFARLHVFPYSVRPGTAAATMSDQVHGTTRKERARRMIDLGRRMSLDFHAAQADREHRVLWETSLDTGEPEAIWSGYTENYIRVTARSAEDLFNRVTAARIVETGPEACGAERCGLSIRRDVD